MIQYPCYANMRARQGSISLEQTVCKVRALGMPVGPGIQSGLHISKCNLIELHGILISGLAALPVLLQPSNRCLSGLYGILMRAGLSTLFTYTEAISEVCLTILLM